VPVKVTLSWLPFLYQLDLSAHREPLVIVAACVVLMVALSFTRRRKPPRY
jgi:hypothetical protein